MTLPCQISFSDLHQQMVAILSYDLIQPSSGSLQTGTYWPSSMVSSFCGVDIYYMVKCFKSFDDGIHSLLCDCNIWIKYQANILRQGPRWQYERWHLNVVIHESIEGEGKGFKDSLVFKLNVLWCCKRFKWLKIACHI